MPVDYETSILINDVVMDVLLNTEQKHHKQLSKSILYSQLSKEFLRNLERQLNESKNAPTIVSNCQNRLSERRFAVAECHMCEKLIIEQALVELIVLENISQCTL